MNIYIKLLEVQRLLPIIEKDTPNPFYKSKYATVDGILEVVKPLCTAQGLHLSQPLTNIDGKAAIAINLVDIESGDRIKEVFPLIEHTDPQKQGAIITYTKRQSLASFFCIQMNDDDDGNSVSKPSVKPQEAPGSVGVPKCDKCHSDMVPGKGGSPYCVVCYKAYKASQGSVKT